MLCQWRTRPSTTRSLLESASRLSSEEGDSTGLVAPLAIGTGTGDPGVVIDVGTGDPIALYIGDPGPLGAGDNGALATARPTAGALPKGRGAGTDTSGISGTGSGSGARDNRSRSMPWVQVALLAEPGS